MKIQITAQQHPRVSCAPAEECLRVIQLITQERIIKYPLVSEMDEWWPLVLLSKCCYHLITSRAIFSPYRHFNTAAKCLWSYGWCFLSADSARNQREMVRRRVREREFSYLTFCVTSQDNLHLCARVLAAQEEQKWCCCGAVPPAVDRGRDVWLNSCPHHGT